MPEGLGHEKLRVYQRGLDSVTWSHPVLAGIQPSAVVLDHWARAAESILENIANGNSRRSQADRNQYFDVAIGSALECAACLDICHRREMISNDQLVPGKQMLKPIVNMTIGLRKAKSASVREETEPYLAVQYGCISPMRRWTLTSRHWNWSRGFTGSWDTEPSILDTRSGWTKRQQVWC